MKANLLSAADVKALGTKVLTDVHREQMQAHRLVVLSWMWLRYNPA